MKKFISRFLTPPKDRHSLILNAQYYTDPDEKCILCTTAGRLILFVLVIVILTLLLMTGLSLQNSAQNAKAFAFMDTLLGIEFGAFLLSLIYAFYKRMLKISK